MKDTSPPGAAGPKPSDRVLRRDRKEQRQAQKRSHVEMEAETEGRGQQPRDAWGPQMPGAAGRTVPKSTALGHINVTLLVPRTRAGRMSALWSFVTAAPEHPCEAHPPSFPPAGTGKRSLQAVSPGLLLTRWSRHPRGSGKVPPVLAAVIAPRPSVFMWTQRASHQTRDEGWGGEALAECGRGQTRTRGHHCPQRF